MAQSYAGIPPGPLSAYLGVRQANEQAGMQDVQAATQIQGLLARMQQQQELQKGRAALAQLGPEAGEEDILRATIPFSSPEAVMKAKQTSLDRRAQIAATTEMGKARLQQQASQLEMQNQFNQSRIGAIKDENARKVEADKWERIYQQGQLDIQRGNLEIRQQLAQLKMIPGNERLKAPELLHYIDKEGNHPPAGSTLNQVIEKGFKLASTQEINMLLAGRGAESTVNQLDKYVESIWGKEGEDKLEPGVRKRLMTGAEFAIDRAKQSNPDLNAYESFAKGTLAPLIRAIGEKGALSDKDIERALNLVPKTGDKLGELPDTSVVARHKMQQLRQWFTNALGKNSGIQKINSDAEYNALPSGTEFIAPDGTRRKKP